MSETDQVILLTFLQLILLCSLYILLVIMNYDRDDAGLRQFASRARQPKVIAGAPTAAQVGTHNPSPVNVFIVYDSGFGNSLNQIDDNRFRHMGLSPVISSRSESNARRIQHDSVGSGFQ